MRRSPVVTKSVSAVLFDGDAADYRLLQLQRLRLRLLIAGEKSPSSG